MDQAVNEIEKNVEAHIMGTTVRLSDGSEAKVFSRGARNSHGSFQYTCHVCTVLNLIGERLLHQHIAGKKHQQKVKNPMIDAESFRNAKNPKNKIQMHIAPGEPVPPGFENEIKRLGDLQEMVDNYKEEPLVGLEYVIELIGESGNETAYMCTLCDKREDPRTVLLHLISQNHRQKFLDKHFPSSGIYHLDAYKHHRDIKSVTEKALKYACQQIELHYGRLPPNACEANEFIRKRTKLIQEITADKHLDEKNGPKLTNILSKLYIMDNFNYNRGSAVGRNRSPSPVDISKHRKLSRDSRKNALDSVSSISSDDEDIKRQRSCSRSEDRSRIVNSRRSPSLQSRSSHHSLQSKRTKSRSRSPFSSRIAENAYRNSKPSAIIGHPKFQGELKRKALPTPKELSAQAFAISQEGYIWEKYRCKVEIAVAALEKDFKEHEKNPEKHPNYSDEWKRFWSRRYKELQADGTDAMKHDFKAEWISFWTRRMKELHNFEIDKKKIEIRKRLNLPPESKEKTEELKEKFKMSVKKASPPKTGQLGSPIRIDSDSDDDVSRDSSASQRKRRREREREREKRSRDSRKASRSPLSDYADFEEYQRSRKRGQPGHSESRVREPVKDRYAEYRKFMDKEQAKEEVKVDYDKWKSNYYGPNRSTFIRESVEPSPVSYCEAMDDGPVTLISVCRLLSALEDHLGSLGPKVLDLLAKALSLEKVKGNASEECLLNEDNCVFFETVKEKLKGQLMAGMFPVHKVNAVKRSIRNIASLLHEVHNKPKTENSNSSEMFAATTSASVTKVEVEEKNKIGNGIDKTALAKEVTKALIAQGKTDITPAELEELIKVYVSMAEAAQGEEDIEEAAAEIEVSVPKVEDKKEVKITPLAAAMEAENKIIIKDSAPEKDNLESLTDTDLQTLLQNFRDLSSDEQNYLISYLKKMESTDPLRVEKLRNFVDFDDSKQDDEPEVDYGDEKTTKVPKPSTSYNPLEAEKLRLDSEEEYDFDDVIKGVKGVKDEPAKEEKSLKVVSSTSTRPTINMFNDTPNLIANLMGSLHESLRNETPSNSKHPQTISTHMSSSSGKETSAQTKNQKTIGNSNFVASSAYYQQAQPLNEPVQHPDNMYSNHPNMMHQHYQQQNMQNFGGNQSQGQYDMNQYQNMMYNQPMYNQQQWQQQNDPYHQYQGGNGY